MKQRAQTLFTVVVLLGAGALIASWWMEWRHTTLVSPPAAYEGVPGTQAGGSPFSMDNRISIEVLNGAGDPGAAAAVAGRLREMGFDVKTFASAPPYDKARTIVYDRSGRSGAAQIVADSLGLEAPQRELMPDLYLDATVMLGSDWKDVVPGFD